MLLTGVLRSIKLSVLGATVLDMAWHSPDTAPSEPVVVLPPNGQTPEPQEAPSHERFAWWLGVVVPILFACMRLIVVSRGDAETLRALVQNLNITALVLATILPLGSTVAVWLLFGSFLMAVSKNTKNRGAWGLAFLLLLVATPVLVFCAMTLLHATINAAIFVVLIVVLAGLAISQKTRAKLAQRFFTFGTVLSIITVLVAPFVIILALSGMWLPTEQITVGGEVHVPVYVLSSDDRWTVYMDDGHKVHTVPTEDITQRGNLPSSDSNWQKTLADVFAD